MADSKISQTLIDALCGGTLVPFVGSGLGLSVSSDHFPGWDTVFEKMAAKLREEGKAGEAHAVQSLATINQLFPAAEQAERHLGPADFSGVIEQTYGHRDAPEDADLALPEAIWKLQAPLVVTTNYDRILEWSNSRATPRCNPDTQEIAELLRTPTKEYPAIWHLHGHVDRKNTLILSPGAYQKLYGTEGAPEPEQEAALDRLEDLLSQRTLLFIGFGLQDRYVMELIQQVLERFKGFTGKHFALMPKDEADCQALWEKYNIQVIEFEAHGEPLVEQIERMAESAFDEQPPLPASPAPIEPTEPESSEPLPELDRHLILDRFIGRDRLLARLEDLLRGLTERAHGQTPSGTAATQLQWVHGFGGMGKSWYLRRAYMAAEDHATNIDIALIDWDSQAWREPLIGAPHSPRDLFEPIARRLAQLAGAAILRPFREAEQRVARAQKDHQRLRGRFDEQLERLLREGQTGPSMKKLLDDRRMLNEDPDAQARRIKELRADWVENHGLFVNWCHENAEGISDIESAVRPLHLLANGLFQALRNAALRRPILFLLDTCELVSRREELDFWLRQILRPLCQETLPILIMVASRLEPDAATPKGGRRGWQEEISGRLMDVVDFNAESSLLSQGEIEQGLQALHPRVEATKDLAESLQHVSLGVPLAVGTLFDLHRDGSHVLSELNDLADEKHDLEASEAVQAVIEKVAKRMLLHLENKNDPETRKDLESIVALALLTEPDRDVLSRLWPETPVRDRLIELAGRYALIAGADLHARVRDYLRRYWRGESRPAGFTSVLNALDEIVTALPEPDDKDFGTENWVQA
ncbi:MAG: SIR2 family protein, partial [Verrucomicrobiota bacterium]